MSLYADYTKEIHGRHVLEKPHGFVVYEIAGDQCYIADIFVKKEHRKTCLGTIMAKEVEKIAKDAGCKKLLGSVIPTTIGSTISLKALLGYGFRLQSAKENFIWFEKDIE